MASFCDAWHCPVSSLVSPGRAPTHGSPWIMALLGLPTRGLGPPTRGLGPPVFLLKNILFSIIF
jgi:hypothetical protein